MTARSTLRFVLERIERDSEVHTDAYSGYAELDRLRYRHVIANLSEAGDPAHVLLAQVHLVASLVKRGGPRPYRTLTGEDRWSDVEIPVELIVADPSLTLLKLAIRACESRGSSEQPAVA